jgi:6-phosphogluconolactonase
MRQAPNCGPLPSPTSGPASGPSAHTDEAGACHVSVDKTGRCALISNYLSGTITLVPLSLDGRPGEPRTVATHSGASVHPIRQSEPHPHSVIFDPSYRLALAPDLGTDHIAIYRLTRHDHVCKLELATLVGAPPGSGPRHLAFHPTGRYFYVTHELNSTVGTYAFDGQQGTARMLRAWATVPNHCRSANNPADVHVHPSGRSLDTSNRGDDSLATFDLDSNTGTPSQRRNTTARGRAPRNFAIHSSGRWLLAANQDSNAMAGFIVGDSGALMSVEPDAHIASPACVIFDA